MAKSRVLSTLFVALFVVCNYAVELEEIKPWEVSLHERRGLERRDTTVFDLRSAETFLWGAGGGGDAVFGNLTVMMPGNEENILSMERFHGNLKSVQCEATKMTLTFQDDETFDYATKVWDWVNGAANRTFVIVASKGNCGNNEFRVPYKVNALDLDKSSHIAILHASVETWKDIAHTYEMRVGSLDIPDTVLPALVRRDITKSTSIDLGVDFSFTGKIGVASLKCSPCSTAGKLDFEFIIKQDWFVPVGVEFRAQPQGLELKAGVTVTGSFGVSKTGTNTSDDRIPLIQYPLPGGVSIPGGIFSLGPQLVAELGWEFTATQVSILVKTGATVTFSDNAILQADLLDLTQNKFSGWVPHVTFDPLQIQAQESLKLQVYVAPSIELEAEALGQGVEAGIMLKAPYVQVEGDVIDSLNNGGACTAGDGKEFALKLVPSWGVQIDLQAGSIKGKDVTVSLATASFPWPGLPSDWCWAFDDPNNNNGNPNPSNPAPTLPASSPNPSPGPGVNTCSVNGRPGTCIDSNACTNGGKVATPGYCPDDPANVQCCTDNDSTTPSANSCSVNGKAGTCLDTTDCKNSGKVATPGYCPNDPANVQCCTANSAPPGSSPPSANSCSVNGKAGTCLDTTDCKNSGKVATPGYCPNDPANVQCCTASESTPPSANSCSVNGKAGTCLDTTSCKNSGKVATPGYCPDDPANVQCCTASDSTPPSANSCSVNGKAGTCLDTTSCKNSGKVATPGYCPNDPANVQCCTSADTSNIGKIIYSVGGLGHYPVTDDVNCRSGPGTSFDVQKTYPKGQDVSVTCQAPGTDVNGDTLWDKTSDDCYVSDYYVHTGTSNYVATKCDDSTAAHVYAVKDDVNCRSGPGTSFDVQKTYPKGQDVTLTCQAPGTNVNDDTLWDKTTDGCYVADWYVHTGTSNYVTAKCDDSSGSSGGSGSCGAPHSNQATIDLIAGFEGFVSQVYNDPTGHPTIGYGHLCKNTGCSEVGFPIPLSEADGKKLLAQDLTQFEQCITDMTNEKATINLNEYGALVSWSYNVGCGAAKSSTLIERLNNGEDPKVVLSSELPQWDKSDGQVLSGLLRRRNAEIALAQTQSSDPALPVKC